MTGNEFLKHSPHKNKGDMPFAEYVRMRFQMEAANLPYMKRNVPGGVLEVRKVYGTQYQAFFTRIEGGEVTWMAVYYIDATTQRVAFYNKQLLKLGDFLLDDLSITPPFIGAQTEQIRVGDLIAFIYIGKTVLNRNKYTVKFYNTLTGLFLDNEWDFDYYNIYDLSYGGNVYYTDSTDNIRIPVFSCFSVTDKLYVIIGKYGEASEITRIEPVLEDNGSYTFNESTYQSTLPSPVGKIGPMHCENGTLFCQQEESAVKYVIGYDRDTGAISSTLQSGSDGGYPIAHFTIHRSPNVNYTYDFDFTIPKQYNNMVNFPFGSVSGISTGEINTYALVYQTPLGKIAYPVFNTPDYTVYDIVGLIGDFSISFDYDNTVHYDKNGFDETDELLYGLLQNQFWYMPNREVTCIGRFKSTKEELYELFGLTGVYDSSVWSWRSSYYYYIPGYKDQGILSLLGV